MAFERKKYLRALLAILSVLAILPASSCRRWWPQSEEIPGTWTIAPETRHFLPEQTRSAAATFEFRADGTFTATEIPAEIVFVSTEKSGPLLSGSGTWQLVSQNVGYVISLSFKKFTLGKPERIPADTTVLGAEREQGVTRLHYFLDDPDLGRKVIFTPKSN